MSVACPTCGFDGSSLSPADAAVALRSFPRRFRSVLVRPPAQDGDDPVTRRGSAGRSAMEHAEWAAATIEEIDHQLQQVLVHDQPEVTAPAIETPFPPAGVTAPGGPVAVLERVTAAATALAATVEGASGRQWSRTAAPAGGATVTALDLVRLAVHQGVHHLKAAEQVLAEVVGRP